MLHPHVVLAKLPTIAAYSYKKSIGQPLIYPRNDRSYCENFLQMMFAVPCEEYEIDPDFAEALDMPEGETLLPLGQLFVRVGLLCDWQG